MAPESLEEFLLVYDHYRADVEAGRVSIEPMIYNAPEVSGPVTVAGCRALAFTENLGAHILLEIFDEHISLPIGSKIANPTDLQYANYAFGSPRTHLFQYLNERWVKRFCGFVDERYHAVIGNLASSSCAVDLQAGVEKTAAALTAALQGARTFTGAGNLCVDDLFSGVQLVLDVEIVNHIRELIESFCPDRSISTMNGMYQAIVDVAEKNDMFLSHESTVQLFRKIMPSSDVFHREKLRSWQAHRKTAKDRARAIAHERIRKHDFHLEEKQMRELARIAKQAKKHLVG
ncbi:MAG: trimethylamine methyltransferase family protein [Candidatus Omnitrophica bacterium]|nr:trimethylamine methyltransferase family protein [Candidatus Omnitrophota bacterium]MCM8827923.1 trimethylamine methyltransferase family protein [Candidatus Omnitrophota bacterium]